MPGRALAVARLAGGADHDGRLGAVLVLDVHRRPATTHVTLSAACLERGVDERGHGGGSGRQRPSSSWTRSSLT